MLTRLLTLLSICLLALPVQADIYKCRLPNGKTEISNAPCASGSGTITARPDESVSEENRLQAERDVERMQNFVKQREASQRADEKSERERQASENQALAQQRVYASGSMDECLNELAQQAVDSKRRAELEAICRAKPKNEPALVGVPVFGGGGINHGSNACIQHVLRQNLSPAEQNRRIAQCQGSYVAPSPAPQPAAKPVEPKLEMKPAKPCQPGDKFCVR